MWGVAAHPQIVDRIVDEPWLEVRLLPHETARCHHLVDDELRLISSEIEPPFCSDPLHDGVEDFLGKGQSLAFALLLEDALINFEARASDTRLRVKCAQ